MSNLPKKGGYIDREATQRNAEDIYAAEKDAYEFAQLHFSEDQKKYASIMHRHFLTIIRLIQQGATLRPE